MQDHAGFRVLGTTLDDAAGEAFDKGARLLGLGYPGGAEIDRLAREGDPAAYDFPVARVPGLDFSFSGVKTALLYAVRDLRADELEARRADLAASYQRAIVRALVERDARGRGAADRTDRDRRRRRRQLRAARRAARARSPRRSQLCTDNAAMIASAGALRRACRRPPPTGRVCGGVARAACAALARRRRGRDRWSSRPAGASRPPCRHRAPRPRPLERARRRPARRRSAPASGCSSS